MTIFLAILKIIGVLLLSLLCLVVGLVLLLLFVPICYEAEIVSAEKVSVKAKITWLLHLVRLLLKFQDEFSMKLWVLCFSVPFGKQKKDDTENYEHTEQARTVETLKSAEIKSHAESTKETESTDSSEYTKNVDHSENTEHTNDAEFSKCIPKTENVKTKKENWLLRIKRIFGSILDKIKHIGKSMERVKALLEDPHNQAALSHIKDEVFLLLKHICPKKLKVDMAYSTGSPDTTAEVFGILAMFPIGYQNRWKIYPDFEADSLYAKGTIDIKGKIYIYQILFAALRLILDKNCRRFMKKIKK